MRASLSVMRWQLGTWRGNVRIVLAFAVCAVASLFRMSALKDFAAVGGDPLQMFEPFIYNSTDYFVNTLMFLGLLLLLADAPFTEQSATYSLVRSSRLQWVMGKLMYIFLSCVIYYAFSLAVTVLAVSLDSFSGNAWSAPFYDILNSGNVNAFYLYVEGGSFVKEMSPCFAAFCAFVLELGYGFFCGSLLFLLNLSGSKVLGFAVLSSQHILGYLQGWRYFPFVISIFDRHSFEVGDIYPTITFSVAYFCLLSAVTAVCILVAIRRVDLKITVGTRI